jgi:hypothetical protein
MVVLRSGEEYPDRFYTVKMLVQVMDLYDGHLSILKINYYADLNWIYNNILSYLSRKSKN